MNSGRKSKFTDHHKKFLNNLMITQINPGYILKDFNNLIEYIKSNDITSTKSYNYISIKYLVPINKILTHPIKVNLIRPQKKSFPNISGLFLLLRSIGILKFEYIGKEAFLRIDKNVYKDWSSLNNVEAYFTLLEAWLIRSNPRNVIDEYIPVYESQIKILLEFIEVIPSNGMEISDNKDLAERIKYTPGMYNIALLELFGFIEIIHGEPEPGQAWRIEKIRTNAVGTSILYCLYERLVCTEEFFKFIVYNHCELKSKIPFGQLQDYFIEFFPDWKENLKIQASVFKNGTFTFKVLLGNSWRRISIQSHHTLEDFVNIILESFNFDKDHLYAFYLNDQFGNIIEINSPYCEEGPFTADVKVGESLIEIGSATKFLYDFGDNWEFVIVLEDIKKSDLNFVAPTILEKHGDAPEQYPMW